MHTTLGKAVKLFDEDTRVIVKNKKGQILNIDKITYSIGGVLVIETSNPRSKKHE